MYGQHFGFSSPPFSDGMAQDDAVFRTAAIEELVRDLEIALCRRDGVAIVSGVSGTGKTTIAADTLKRINTRLAFTCISHPPLTPHELLEQLLTDFGFEPYKLSRVERLQLWRQFLSEMAATDTRVCLLMENAADYSPEVLQHLHGLTATDAAMTPGANVVLTTIQPPERILSTEEMLAFNQRVRLRCRIEPLTQDETGAYLRFQCRQGGVDANDVFTGDFASRLYELSGGIFRVMNNLIESALMSAAAAGEPRVSVERLLQVAEQQFGISRLQPEKVDELLDDSVGDRPQDPAAADEIPTLTDFVSGPGSATQSSTS